MINSQCMVRVEVGCVGLNVILGTMDYKLFTSELR